MSGPSAKLQADTLENRRGNQEGANRLLKASAPPPESHESFLEKDSQPPRHFSSHGLSTAPAFLQILHLVPEMPDVVRDLGEDAHVEGIVHEIHDLQSPFEIRRSSAVLGCCGTEL